jgi:hypothetical protein
MATEMRKTYRSRVDEAVKCCRVCRYYAENAQRFLADEVIQTTASKSYWLVFRFLAPGLGGGKCRLARARIERPAVGAEIEGSCYGLDYGGSRRGRYRRRRRKRFVVAETGDEFERSFLQAIEFASLAMMRGRAEKRSRPVRGL